MDTLSRIIHHKLIGPNSPEWDSYKYWYSVFELIQDIDVNIMDAVPSEVCTDTVHFNVELDKMRELQQADTFFDPF